MADQYRVQVQMKAELTVDATSGYEAERKAREQLARIEEQEALKREYEDVDFTVEGVYSRTALG